MRFWWRSAVAALVLVLNRRAGDLERMNVALGGRPGCEGHSLWKPGCPACEVRWRAMYPDLP